MISMLGAGATQAATITINEIIDLSSYSGHLDFIYDPLASPQTIQSGDSVHYTVNFANNKALELTALSSAAQYDFWLGHNSGSANFTINNNQLDAEWSSNKWG